MTRGDLIKFLNGEKRRGGMMGAGILHELADAMIEIIGERSDGAEDRPLSTTIIHLTESQFRRFVETVYAEAYVDGATNGAQQPSDRLWLLSRSKDYMERLIEIDRGTEATK